ncbi:MAG: glycosyltransferase 87 family protein [Terracidiphilus sp.]
MKWKPTSAQRKALLCLFLSGAIFITWGSIIALTSYSGMGAFKAVFYGARCLMQHSDPYNPAVLQRAYEADGGRYSPDPAAAFLFRRAMLVCVNLPTSMLLIAPLALLPLKIASLFWMALNAAGLLLAALLIWRVAETQSLKAATILICILLLNCELVFGLGNLAGIVVSLCVIAVWCFLERRFEYAGVLCLGISLVIKPHDAAMAWFYFLLAGGVYRKRALQAAVVAAVLALPAVLWVSHVSPQWMQEMRSNLALLSAHGSVNDPGPESLTFHSADYVISLQGALSLFRDEPSFYNLASYLMSGSLLVAGAIRVLMSRFTKENAWIALAAIAALSMLPVYHRGYDAKLLLLTVPACSLLWATDARLKWAAGLLTALALLSTADIPSTILLTIMNSLKIGTASIFGKVLTVVVFHPGPLVLLATGIFYLWVYFRRTAESF